MGPLSCQFMRTRMGLVRMHPLQFGIVGHSSLKGVTESLPVTRTRYVIESQEMQAIENSSVGKP